MNTLFAITSHAIPLGWMFVLLAIIFALGLSPRFARRFYPDSPRFLIRLAAPVILASLAVACFQGFAAPALIAVVAVGLMQIGITRHKLRHPHGRDMRR